METKGILLAGVGGQGILRASDILCRVFMAAGLDVKKSEVHGMAQRGGCVTSHVRYGEKVHSPLAKKNDIDILVSFEKMDTLRYLDYVKETGTVIINTEEIYPPAVNLGEAPYPANVAEMVRRFFPKVKDGRCRGAGPSGREYPRRQYGPSGSAFLLPEPLPGAVGKGTSGVLPSETHQGEPGGFPSWVGQSETVSPP